MYSLSHGTNMISVSVSECWIPCSEVGCFCGFERDHKWWHGIVSAPWGSGSFLFCSHLTKWQKRTTRVSQVVQHVLDTAAECNFCSFNTRLPNLPQKCVAIKLSCYLLWQGIVLYIVSSITTKHFPCSFKQ